MRSPLIIVALLASLALPFAAAAQDADALRDMLSSDDSPRADMGEMDNGWLLSRNAGVCSMYSFNDPLVLQVDPAHPENTGMRFQVIDGKIPEKDGTPLPVMLVLRESEAAQFGGYPATAVVSQATVGAYVLQISMKELVEKFPNGFQAMLMDETGAKKLVQSDTLGSRKHLAALAKCADG